MDLNQLLLVLHFFGLTMGFAVSISGMVMMSLINKAAPPEKAVLARFPPVMSRVGDVGLVLLWVTGITLVFTKWGGFGVLPWQFHVKLTAVALLTLVVGYIHMLQGRARRGNAGAAAQIPTVAKIALLLAVTAVVFAVLTFD